MPPPKAIEPRIRAKQEAIAADSGDVISSNLSGWVELFWRILPSDDVGSALPAALPVCIHQRSREPDGEHTNPRLGHHLKVPPRQSLFDEFAARILPTRPARLAAG